MENVIASNVPQSVEEAFKMLDDVLAKEDKQDLLDGVDTHFGLGLWIRNEWLYGAQEGESDAIISDLDRIYNKDFYEEHPECAGRPSLPIFSNAEMFSTYLLELYSAHLKQ